MQHDHNNSLKTIINKWIKESIEWEKNSVKLKRLFSSRIKLFHTHTHTHTHIWSCDWIKNWRKMVKDTLLTLNEHNPINTNRTRASRSAKLVLSR